ncbi:serine threonine- kinase irlB, partial [Paramuricea clavata]
VRPPVKYFSPQKSLTLGKGSMGTSVHVGIMEDGAEVAVKRILKHELEDTAQNELEILSRIDASKSPFIVSYRKCSVLTHAKGTRDWMPAEVIEVIGKEEVGRFKKKSDVQVAGMIAFFISTKGEHPFGPVLERMINISKGNPVNLDMLHDPQVRQFISWLISHNIDGRPYAQEALADPFMVHVPNSLRKIILQRSCI